jgi:hypothetical protein
MLTALRQDRKEPWDESRRQIVEFLLPHVARASAVQQQLALFQSSEALLDNIQLVLSRKISLTRPLEPLNSTEYLICDVD